MSALAIATRFLSALDANDADAVAACFTADGTWWVDTGFDRGAGDQSRDPGPDRPWPLHGLMDAATKADLLRGLPERFPGGCRQRVRRSFAGGPIAVLEVEGDGLFLGERPYRNRYCFVVETHAGQVRAVREYLDTAHSAHVFDGRHLQRRTTAPEPLVDVLAGRDDLSPAERVAAGFLGAVNDGSPADLIARCTPDATWWQDGGRIRTAGPEAAPETDPALVLVGRVPVAIRGQGLAALTDTYPAGLRVAAHRVVAADEPDSSGDLLVAVEAAGRGVHRSGRDYQNRYVFVLTVRDGLIAQIREYCDTRHAFDVYGIDRL